MMSEYIRNEAAKLVRGHETRDPFRIARETGIYLLYRNDFVRLRGMYATCRKDRFIFLNANMDDREKRTVCAHELGHDRLHRAYAQSGALKEFMIYEMQNRVEYEANVFAAHVLIDDDNILPLVFEGHDVTQMAEELGEDINLVLIKLAELGKQGHQIRLPIMPRTDFLRA